MTAEDGKPDASDPATADTVSPEAPAARESDSHRRRIIAPVAVALTILVIIAVAVGWLVWPLGAVQTRDAYVRAHITRIAPQVTGNVEAVPVNDNQRVHKGDVLVRIDARRYRALVAEQQAALGRQQATLAQLKQQIALQKAVITQAEARVAGARAELQRAREEYHRSRGLVADDAAPRRTLDSARAAYRKAKAELSRSRAGVAKAKRQLPVLRDKTRVQQQNIDSARASLRQARIDLDDTVIRAPMTGQLGQLGVSEGNYVTPGKPLMALVPARRRYVIANLKENDLTRVRVGQSVTVNVDAFPDHGFKARVGSLAPASNAEFALIPATNATGNFTEIPQRVPVKIVFTGDDAMLARLAPGLSVEVTIDTRSLARKERTARDDLAKAQTSVTRSLRLDPGDSIDRRPGQP